MTKRYSVVEIFPTFQGEGRWTGRRAVFLRLSGCNMWNGIPADRHKGSGACALWCDTSFAKGSPMDLPTILGKLDAAWGSKVTVPAPRMVVLTGGEPTLQLDRELANGLRDAGWFTAIETNGSNPNDALGLIDHVCVSPKKGSRPLQVTSAHELKVVLPGGAPGAPPEFQWTTSELHDLATRGSWEEMFVQPQDVTDLAHVERTYLHHIRTTPTDRHSGQEQFDANVKACLDFLEVSPGWRLSYQVHKVLGVR